MIASIRLGINGGEPTLGMDILKKSCGRIQDMALQSDMPFSISGAFNGCWPDSVTDYIIANFTQISLSFDGVSDSTMRSGWINYLPAPNNKKVVQSV